MFEESQRLLTKNDESFSHSKICTHRWSIKSISILISKFLLNNSSIL